MEIHLLLILFYVLLKTMLNFTVINFDQLQTYAKIQLKYQP